MKIAYLANVPYPSDRAHAVQITHMCQAFSGQVDGVTLFTSSYRNFSVNEVQDKFGFDIGFNIKQLPPKNLFYKSKLSFYLREILFGWFFWLRHKNEDFDFFYSRHELVLYTLSFLVPVRKLVYESHEAKYNFVVRRLFKKKIKTVVISKGIFDFYVRQGVDGSLLLVADDGIDESFFDNIKNRKKMRDKLKLPHDKFVAMYIGGFDSWKGVDTFFQSANLLRESIQAVAIGGSDEQMKVVKDAYPKVNFLGPLPYRDLRDNQQAADVLVIPNTATISLSSQYTSPLKLFAHMASGVPIVASDIPSLSSVLSSENARLVKPDDPRALAAGICSVQDEYELWCAAAEELKEYARQYTWTERVKKIINFMNN